MSRTATLRHTFIATLITIGSILLLQACGGGGKNPPPPPPPINAPAGFFNQSGSASVRQSDNTTPLDITDLQGMVYGNQFMLVSDAQNVGYFGTITSLSGNAYTATVSIFKDNVPSTTATVSGTIVANTSITGTLTGTGLGNGSFTISYNSAVNTASAIARIQRDSTTPPTTYWADNTSPQSFFGMQITSGGNIQGAMVSSGNFNSCQKTGPATPLAGTALYQISITLSNCLDTSYNGTYTGFAASYQTTAADDTLVLTATSGTRNITGVFQYP